MSAETRRPLTHEEATECRRLHQAWTAYRDRHEEATQELVGLKMGMTQGAVSHYLNGRNPLNLGVAVRFCTLFEVPLTQISPRLNAELKLLRSSSAVDPRDEELIADLNPSERKLFLYLRSFTGADERESAAKLALDLLKVSHKLAKPNGSDQDQNPSR